MRSLAGPMDNEATGAIYQAPVPGSRGTRT